MVRKPWHGVIQYVPPPIYCAALVVRRQHDPTIGPFRTFADIIIQSNAEARLEPRRPTREIR